MSTAPPSMNTPTFVMDIWYYAALAQDVKPGQLIRRVITGEPITIGRHTDGTLFALRDICPHRAAPLSAGRIVDGTVECPYHGWRFGTGNGACQTIPALCADQDIKTDNIKVRSFPVQQTGHLIWVYIGSDKRAQTLPKTEPPSIPLSDSAPRIHDSVVLNCHIDHAVIGLMDPAHGPYVHSQWWWRSETSMHEKSKAFEPRERGFAMAPHSPSSNSFAYKLLGGKPVTEITFQLPSIRTEHIKIGNKTVLSLTALTPISETQTEITQIFFSDKFIFRLLKPFIKRAAKTFLRQDAHMVDLQQMGLAFDPKLMLIEDADTQAKWYYQLKREWAAAQAENRDFKNPVKARTLKWRS